MREEYESVGDLTFYLDDQEQTGQGFARCSIKQDEIHAGTFEDPRATVDGLADIYGVIFLDPKEEQRLLPQCYQQGGVCMAAMRHIPFSRHGSLR
jgi:hypothetical protein